MAKRNVESKKGPNKVPKTNKGTSRATEKKAATRGKKIAPVVPRTPEEREAARKTAMEIGMLALDKKALDVVVLDVRGLASYADYFVVMTAESDPQVNAIADHVALKMKERGNRALSVEGQSTGQWVLIDFGDVVAHVFYQDTRQFYDIEGLWADAKRITVEDK